MKVIATMMLGAVLGLGAAPALAADPAVEAPIQQFVAAFNKGDMAGAAATMNVRVSIIDEVAPFQWRGPDAFARWGASLAADSKAKGYSNESVTLGTPSRELVSGVNAYVIVPATYAFTQKGVKMAEVSQITFTLMKTDAGWKITGWTWTGPEASAVK
jgi:ketosteroid isomerase-like protein